MPAGGSLTTFSSTPTACVTPRSSLIIAGSMIVGLRAPLIVSWSTSDASVAILSYVSTFFVDCRLSIVLTKSCEAV